MTPQRIRSKGDRHQVDHGQTDILSVLPRFDYEHEHRFTEHEHDDYDCMPERQWSPMSPETTLQKVSKAPAATSVHHMVPSCVVPSSGYSSCRQVWSMKVWIAFQLLYVTQLYLGVLASPHPAFGTPLPRAGEGKGVRAANILFWRITSFESRS
jgi:hypothetical protein